MPKLVRIMHRALAISSTLPGLVATAGLWACAATNPTASGETEPVNYLVVSERLVTSGQPSAAQITALDALEYRIVINLAPGEGDTGFPDEARLLGSKGISYLAIPVELQRPLYQDFVLFSRVLDSAGNGRVWVHCRLNNRASIFAFLYRVIHEGADPDTAYEKVTQVWVPAPNWLRFARDTLAKHNISYDF